MEQTGKKNLGYYMRVLHRDLGFFVIGLTIVYALSGIVLIYRDKGFMNAEVQVEKTLPANLELRELGRELRIRDLREIKTEGDVVYFESGSYNKTTGQAVYKTREVIFPFNKFIELHKSNSREAAHWFLTLYSIVLVFLSISSFWMFKVSTNSFRRGLYISGAGILFTILIFLI